MRQKVWTPDDGRTPDKWEFKVTIPIFRAVEENGDHYIEGLGGDAEPDGYGERLSRECIDDLKVQATLKQIPFIKSHWNERGEGIKTPDWWEEMGHLVDMLVTTKGQMFPKIWLDMDVAYSRSLYGKIQKGKQFGLSYGGRVIEAYFEDAEEGLSRKVFQKLELWHFVPTTKPVNRRTFNNPLKIVAKSFNDWDTVETIKSDRAVDFDDYEDRKQVFAIYKSWDESGRADDFKEEETPEEVMKEKWFQRHGVKTEGELDDGDFAWLSDAYRKMTPEQRKKANKSDHRKLPYKVHGKVYEDGWKAAWGAAHGSRGGMSFAGGPSQSQVIQKLLRAKPKGVKVTKSEKYPDELLVVEGYGVFRSEDHDAFDLALTATKSEKEETRMGLTIEEINEIASKTASAVAAAVGPAVETAFKSVPDAIGEAVKKAIPEPKAPETKPDEDGKGFAFKSEDEFKDSVKTVVKEAMGDVVKAALKSGKEPGDPGDGDPKAVFKSLVTEVLNGKKKPEEIEDEVMRARVMKAAEDYTANVLRTFAGETQQ